MPELEIPDFTTAMRGEADFIAARGSAAKNALQPLHVLLVDDDALVRGGTAEMLSEAGCLVTEAASGREALDMFHADSSIAMLITDYRMPGMTGTTLIRHIRRNAPALPVLLMTGYSSGHEDIGGDVALLSKPFREAGLVAAVRKLCMRAEAARF